jgi:hypothetical protein
VPAACNKGAANDNNNIRREKRVRGVSGVAHLISQHTSCSLTTQFKEACSHLKYSFTLISVISFESAIIIVKDGYVIIKFYDFLFDDSTLISRY